MIFPLPVSFTQLILHLEWFSGWPLRGSSLDPAEFQLDIHRDLEGLKSARFLREVIHFSDSQFPPSSSFEAGERRGDNQVSSTWCTLSEHVVN